MGLGSLQAGDKEVISGLGVAEPVTNDRDLDRLLDACAEYPDEFDRRLIAADRAEEIGDYDLAACLRWMAQEERRAYFGATTPTGRSKWTWWEEGAWFSKDCSLPPDLYRHKDELFDTHDWHPTCRLADDALYRTWRLVRGKK